MPTNGRNIDLKGRFDTRQEADKVVEAVNAIKRKHRDRINEAQDAYNRAIPNEGREITEYLQGLSDV